MHIFMYTLCSVRIFLPYFKSQSSRSFKEAPHQQRDSVQFDLHIYTYTYVKCEETNLSDTTVFALVCREENARHKKNQGKYFCFVLLLRNK